MKDIPFRIGARVRHITYGPGTLTAIEGKRERGRDERMLVIQFDSMATPQRMYWVFAKNTLGEIK